MRRNKYIHHEQKEAIEDMEEWITMKFKDLPEQVKDYIKEHPYQTAFHVINGVVFFAPSLVWGPVLGMLGFTPIGPAASTLASAAQSFIHPVVAKGVFATCQSAKMGGYGAGILDTAVRFGMKLSTVGSRVKECFDDKRKEDQEDEGK
ncbi:uncharacterized protein I303_106709 [Kwoniella dejecticola CBS 10117]|uniref:Uncharacterized protein n=1 Tax=Kwoniella dejecticola CBS 10117 TaxID=1296121 RepID=A0A1A5ZTX9_9TREE|nr:uncharacterized protein I303_08649 [Kwoniella dejecticola CBS 10117]OBR81263.1 hypothetical protein I303_08649 [Kwoniella dejecticola CBS 10117]